MAAPWHRVAFDVSVFDVDELLDVMAAHGWALDGEEPTGHARIKRVWFTPVDDEPTLPGEPDTIEWAAQPAPEPPALTLDDLDPHPDPGQAHRGHVQDLMLAQEAWDRLDDDGGRNPFAPPWGGGWLPGG